jgi:streptogramin lyase
VVSISLPKKPASEILGATHLLATGSDIWTSDGLFRIDPSSLQASLGLDGDRGASIGYIAVDEGSVWGSDYDAGMVRHYRKDTGSLVASVPLDTPEGIVEAAGSIWVASHHGGTISRIDPQRNVITQAIALTPPGNSGPQGVAAGFGSIWVGVPNQSAVFRVNAQTGAVIAQITDPKGFDPCGDVATGGTSVWVSECGDGTRVARIDASSNAFALVMETGGNVAGGAADGDSVWFVTSTDPNSPGPAHPPMLEKLGPTGSVERKVQLQDGFVTGGIALAFGHVWLSSPDRSVVLRLPSD